MAISKPCRLCGATTRPTPSQIKRGDYACRPCRTAMAAKYRAARLARGLPPYRSESSPEQRARWVAAAHARYHSSPEYRAKQIARATARKAIRDGRLTRGPCEVCGTTPTEAHHDDYSQPQKVRWLCPLHHREHHAALRRAA